MPPKPKPKPRTPPRAAGGGGSRRNLLLAVAGAAAVVAVLIVASLLLTGGDDEASTTVPTTGNDVAELFAGIPQDGALLGSDTAPVTMIQFEDLQCPVCRTYQTDGFPDIVAEYVRPGRVRLRFVGLSFIGPDSEKALRYVLAAGEQGKLWEMSESLYRAQGDENSGWVTDELVDGIAGGLGLDVDRLGADAESDAVTRQVESMAAEAERRQVPGTPWFFVQIGDQEPYEVRPTSLSIDGFRPILDDALASAP